MHGSVSYARAENYCELRVASLLIATLKRKTAAGAIAPTSSRKVRGDESTSTSPPGAAHHAHQEPDDPTGERQCGPTRRRNRAGGDHQYEVRGRGYENADGKCRRTEMSRQEQDGQHRAQEPVENQDAEDDRVEPRQRRSCRGVRVVLDRRHGFDSGLSVVIARARGPSRQAPRLAPEKHEADQGTGGNPSRVSK